MPPAVGSTSKARNEHRNEHRLDRHWRVAIVCLVLAVLLPVYQAVRRLTHRPLPSLKIAVVIPLSGPQESHGRSIVDAVRLYFNDVNRQGGVAGHPVELVGYDDQGDPEVARQRAKEAAASPALAVLGHLYSDTSSAAGPIYKAAHIPVITASANDPGITKSNSYYFRAVMDNSSQGHTLAAYAAKVLGNKRASVLYADDSYGKTLLAAFADEYADQGGTLEAQWAWNPQGSAQEHAALMQHVSEEIANGEGGIVVLAVTPSESAKEALLFLRRTGVNPLILGGTWLGTDFPKQFQSEPEEKREPGFFTNQYVHRHAGHL